MSEKFHTRSDIPVLIAVSVFVAVAWHAVAKRLGRLCCSMNRRGMQLCVASSTNHTYFYSMLWRDLVSGKKDVKDADFSQPSLTSH